MNTAIARSVVPLGEVTAISSVRGSQSVVRSISAVPAAERQTSSNSCSLSAKPFFSPHAHISPIKRAKYAMELEVNAVIGLRSDSSVSKIIPEQENMSHANR